ncbi:MAG: hypothetical protein M1814_004272 [Vezdaea aestivalis]|nr:MAG: hypothetical protein M1814_004272 [Vezdaea aestivalis]
MPSRTSRESSPSEASSDSLETPSSPPSDINPYEVFEIESTATADEIKKAYRKLALIHHPDKVAPEQKDSAHESFQRLAFAYSILSDPRRRSRYDLTGSTSETLDLADDDFDWTSYYREQFADVISPSSIEEFASVYQGSEEERGDLLEAYTKYEGDMNAVFEVVMCSDPREDEGRFRKCVEEAIEKGEVESFKRFVKEGKAGRKKRAERAAREEAEAKELAEELGIQEPKTRKGKGKKDEVDEDALKAIISQRQNGRGQDFLARLEEKYAPKGGSKGGKRKKMEEPPEEMFAKKTLANGSKRSKK